MTKEERTGAVVLKRKEATGSQKVYAHIDGLAFDSMIEGEGLKAATQKVLDEAGQNFEQLDYLELASSGFEKLDRIEQDLSEYGDVEQRPKMEGRQLIMVLSPSKKQK